MASTMAARKLKWTYLAFLFASMAGALFVSGRNTGEASLMEAFALSIIAYPWVMTDSRQRDFKVGPFFTAGVICLGFIFVPAYLIRSRGIRIASKRMGIFVVQVIGLILAYAILSTALKMSGLVRVFRIS